MKNSFQKTRGDDSLSRISRTGQDQDRPAVELRNRSGRAAALIVCEHASNRIPAEFGDLGLSGAQLASHIAWDPGAMAVARHLSRLWDAPLVAATASRLLYDCNRAPEAPDAIPARSEWHDIPGNQGLSDAARAERIGRFHDPFRRLLADTLDRRPPGCALVTIHSFTPIYKSRPRSVEIGILHDSDSRLADAMLARAGAHTDARVARNDPYGPEQGVTHTLKVHALPRGLPNVMVEIRNDLIVTGAEQRAMAAMLGAWIDAARTDIADAGRERAEPAEETPCRK